MGAMLSRKNPSVRAPTEARATLTAALCRRLGAGDSANAKTKTVTWMIIDSAGTSVLRTERAPDGPEIADAIARTVSELNAIANELGIGYVCALVCNRDRVELA